MPGSSFPRLCLKWSVRTLAGLVLLVVVVFAVAVIYVDHARGPLTRFFSEHTNRRIRVDGAFEAHLLTLHPSVTAGRVTIGNPPWAPPGSLAEIERLRVVFDLPWFGRPFGIHLLEMDGASLHLVRNATGYANWKWNEPGTGPGKGPPLVRSLSMPNAHVDVNDARRRLEFTGVASAGDESGGAAGRGSLEIRGAGELNGRPATFAINGDPLARVRQDRPYRFAFDERSSGSRLSGRGFLPHPFDFRALEARFAATGEDMKDLYFLVGVSLPETGAYKLSGEAVREGRHIQFLGLAATSGRSDMRGSIVIDSANGHSHLEAQLHSGLLRLADLGKRAADRAPEPAGAKFLIPDTALNFAGTRKSDSIFNFRADALEAGHLALNSVAARLTVERGVLALTALSAALPEGRISGHGRLDATHETLKADLDLKITDLQISQFARGSNPPPFEGPLRARVVVSGHGRSLHDFASTANGTLTAVLPHGEVRASLAELAGLDLANGVGLMATRNQKNAGIRCGLASFEAREGVLTARNFSIDTDPVLITGEGSIHLDTETVDFKLHGKPKHMRLRLRSPVTVRGTLAHPSLGMAPGTSLAQAGGAVAIGVLLTPLAAVLAFVDPGLAKDADCAALVAQAAPPGPEARTRK